MNKLSVLDLVSQKYPENSKSSLRKWIRNGRILIDGKKIKKEALLVEAEGQVELLKKELSPYPFKILFEDKELIVVNKPDNILSVASLDPNESNVHDYLKKELKPLKIYPVHRLDREVSGPLIFAKSKKAYLLLREAFYEKQVKREYRAIVHGTLQDQGTWESYLDEKKNYKVHVSQEKGKHAITHYRVLAFNEKASFIALTLDTGRKNQLRVHTSDALHPIFGDAKYGNPEEESQKLALYACRLEFNHPIAKKMLTFEVEPPFFFRRLLTQLKLFS